MKNLSYPSLLSSPSLHPFLSPLLATTYTMPTTESSLIQQIHAIMCNPIPSESHTSELLSQLSSIAPSDDSSLQSAISAFTQQKHLTPQQSAQHAAWLQTLMACIPPDQATIDETTDTSSDHDVPPTASIQPIQSQTEHTTLPQPSYEAPHTAAPAPSGTSTSGYMPPMPPGLPPGIPELLQAWYSAGFAAGSYTVSTAWRQYCASMGIPTDEPSEAGAVATTGEMEDDESDYGDEIGAVVWHRDHDT